MESMRYSFRSNVGVALDIHSIVRYTCAYT